MVQKDYPEIMTLAQAAEYFQVSRMTIQRMLARGDLKGSKIGSAWRFRKEDLDDYLDRNSNKNTD